MGKLTAQIECAKSVSCAQKRTPSTLSTSHSRGSVVKRKVTGASGNVPRSFSFQLGIQWRCLNLDRPHTACVQPNVGSTHRLALRDRIRRAFRISMVSTAVGTPVCSSDLRCDHVPDSTSVARPAVVLRLDSTIVHSSWTRLQLSARSALLPLSVLGAQPAQQLP